MRGATGITHAELHSKIKEKFAENSWRVNSNAGTIRTWSEHDPTMIRTWSDHELVISHPPVRRGYFSRFGDAFCIENYNISRSGYLLKFHRILRLPRKVTLWHHQILRLPRKVTLRHHQMLRLPRKVTLRHHQILRLPWKVTLNCYLTALLLVIWLELCLYYISCYLTELSEQLLHCCYLTELLLDWAVTLLSCYLTDQLLHCCSLTELLLYWAVTLLSCYFTELLLYWAVALLNCYFTEPLLYWTVTAFLNLRNSEVSQLNFLWIYCISQTLQTPCMVYLPTFSPKTTQHVGK